MLLTLGIPAILGCIYMECRPSLRLIRTSGAAADAGIDWNGNVNLLFPSFLVTLGLLLLWGTRPDLRGEIPVAAAVFTVVNLVVHWFSCWIVARSLDSPQFATSQLAAMYRDHRRFNYFDLAAYWTLVQLGLTVLWRLA